MFPCSNTRLKGEYLNDRCNASPIQLRAGLYGAPLLAQEPEYAEALRCTGKREQQFRALLDDAALERLDALLDERNLLAFHQEQAMFRAGFSLAAELGRA